jgi:hypothetical protein
MHIIMAYERFTVFHEVITVGLRTSEKAYHLGLCELNCFPVLPDAIIVGFIAIKNPLKGILLSFLYL